MRMFRRRAARMDSNEIATHAVLHAHGGITTVVSAVALVFSAYSLWETSLKQADLTAYVTGVVTYERDLTADEYIQPTGGFEVFAVPITLANSGARDAPVLGLQLAVNNPKTGLSARFEATYTADAAYFANTGAKRPKTPFSALVIPGRSSWTGTVLFYPASYSNEKALTPLVKVRALNEELRNKSGPSEEHQSTGGAVTMTIKKYPDFPELEAYRAKVLNQSDTVEVALKLVLPAPGGWLDRALGTQVQPVTLTLEMPDIPASRVTRGELVRLRSTATKS